MAQKKGKEINPNNRRPGKKGPQKWRWAKKGGKSPQRIIGTEI